MDYLPSHRTTGSRHGTHETAPSDRSVTMATKGRADRAVRPSVDVDDDDDDGGGVPVIPAIPCFAAHSPGHV